MYLRKVELVSSYPMLAYFVSIKTASKLFELVENGFYLREDDQPANEQL